MDDLKSISHDSDGLGLLTSISSLEADGADDSLNKWTDGLLELLLLISASGMRNEDSALRGLDGDVVGQNDLVDDKSLILPSPVQLWNSGEGGLVVV